MITLTHNEREMRKAVRYSLNKQIEVQLNILADNPNNAVARIRLYMAEDKLEAYLIPCNCSHPTCELMI